MLNVTKHRILIRTGIKIFSLFLQSMKKLFLLTIFLGLLTAGAEAQETTYPANTPIPVPPPQPEQKAPYLTAKEYPSFKILETDSVTVFNTSGVPKGRKSALVFFDPNCSHCIAFFQKLLPAMDSFKNVDFYLMTVMHDMSKVRKFCEDNDIKKYKNIKVVGRDMDFAFIPYFGLRNFPGIALYDKHKKVIHFFEGEGTKTGELHKYANE